MRLITALTALSIGAVSLTAGEPNTLSAKEKKAGFVMLFDGKTTKGWRNFRKDSVSPKWKIIDGALTLTGGGAGDIITDKTYESFELILEYNISKGGNSGLMFHVSEKAGSPWQTGPEIQLQDNKDGHDPQLSGWLYQLYKPDTDATKPVGQWNEIRFLMTPEKGAVWMNGVKYYEFVKGSKDWNARVAKSKFNSMPDFGKPTTGHICLQDHGNKIAFRNIRIREIN